MGTCQEKGKKGFLPLPLTQNLHWEPTDRWLVTSSQPLLVSRHMFSQTSSQSHSQCSCTNNGLEPVLQVKTSHSGITAEKGLFTGQPCRPRPRSSCSPVPTLPLLMARLLTWTSSGSCVAPPRADSAHQYKHE